MSVLHTNVELDYPESDGLPMGETDLYRDWMSRILDMLRFRYRGRRVYVASNLLVYYEEGSPFRFIVPDVFVVPDCEPHRRRIFKTWEEGTVPQVVFEVTSRSTQHEDQVKKPPIYERLGVEEIFLYDPTAEYLDPQLQGFRLDGQYCRIEPDASGGLESRSLDLVLKLEQGELVMIDRSTGRSLLTAEEAEHEARRLAEAAATQEAAARRAAEARAAEAEAQAAAAAEELRRLREELNRKSTGR